MKAIPLLFVIFLSAIPLKLIAGDKERNMLAYTEIGGGGNYLAAKLGGTIVLNQTHSFSIVGYVHSLYANNVPDDFEMGGLQLWGPYELTEDHLSVDILYGRLVNDVKTKVVRLNMRAGISLGSFSYPVNFVPYVDPDPGIFSFGSDNYTYQYINKRTVGLALNPLIELAFSRPFGISIGGYANINNHRSYARLEINLLFGKTRLRHAR